MSKRIFFSVMVLTSLSVLGSEKTDNVRCIDIYFQAMSLPTWPEDRSRLCEKYPKCQQEAIFHAIAQRAFDVNNFAVMDRAFTERNDLEHPLKKEWQQLPGRSKEAAINGGLGFFGGSVLGFALGALWYSKK